MSAAEYNIPEYQNSQHQYCGNLNVALNYLPKTGKGRIYK